MSLQELVGRALAKWMVETHKLTIEQAFSFENFQDWQVIMDAFIAGWAACFWSDDSLD